MIGLDVFYLMKFDLLISSKVELDLFGGQYKHTGLVILTIFHALS